MRQVKPMQPSDFQWAVNLANTMNWNMAIGDFQFARSLEPQGCLRLSAHAPRSGRGSLAPQVPRFTSNRSPG